MEGQSSLVLKVMCNVLTSGYGGAQLPVLKVICNVLTSGYGGAPSRLVYPEQMRHHHQKVSCIHHNIIEKLQTNKSGAIVAVIIW
jgi:hypothetical protein